MKKIYRHILIVVSVVVGVYGVGLLCVQEGSFLDRSMATISYPFVCVKRTWIRFYESIHHTLEVHRNAEKICGDLQKKYDDLQAHYLALLGTKTQWEEINELIDFQKRYQASHALVVDIIGKQFSPAEHFYLIEGGSNKGIQKDMVAVYKNCLVGRVSHVYDRYSKVVLITDPHCKVAALCIASHDRGIHEGTGSLTSTRLSYVFGTQMDLEKRLQKGDFIISSGEGLVFPKGFGLGTILEHKKNDLRVDITVKPLLDLKKLDYCCIIAKGAELSESDYSGTLNTTQESPADIFLKKQHVEAEKQALEVQPTVTETAHQMVVVEKPVVEKMAQNTQQPLSVEAPVCMPVIEEPSAAQVPASARQEAIVPDDQQQKMAQDEVPGVEQ